jgi:hypothetical protein
MIATYVVKTEMLEYVFLFKLFSTNGGFIFVYLFV